MTNAQKRAESVTAARTPLKLPYSRFATFRQIAFQAQPQPEKCDRCGDSNNPLIVQVDDQGQRVCAECAEKETP